jgi:hypothetical protein
MACADANVAAALELEQVDLGRGQRRASAVAAIGAVRAVEIL